MAGDGEPCGIDILHSGEHCIGRDSAHGRILDLRTVGSLAVVVVEEAQVGEVEQQLVALDARVDHDVGLVLHAVLTEIHLDPVVGPAALPHRDVGVAVAELVKAHDNDSASCKLDSVACARLMVVLVAVQEQDSGRLVLRRGSGGRVELVLQFTQFVQGDGSFGDDDFPEILLDEVREHHADEHRGHKDNKNDDVLNGFLHIYPPRKA